MPIPPVESPTVAPASTQAQPSAQIRAEGEVPAELRGARRSSSSVLGRVAWICARAVMCAVSLGISELVLSHVARKRELATPVRVSQAMNGLLRLVRTEKAGEAELARSISEHLTYRPDTPRQQLEYARLVLIMAADKDPELKQAMREADAATIDWGRVSDEIRHDAKPEDILEGMSAGMRYRAFSLEGKGDYARGFLGEKMEADPDFLGLLIEKAAFPELFAQKTA